MNTKTTIELQEELQVIYEKIDHCNAMAGFEPPVGAGNVISTATQEELAPSLIKSWNKVA